jgi:hypothetical protein
MRNARGCVNGVVSTSISGDLCKQSRCFTLRSLVTGLIHLEGFLLMLFIFWEGAPASFLACM